MARPEASAGRMQNAQPAGTRCAARRLEPVIRYFALAFIFFQVATTAALATQVVLFEGEIADVLSLHLAGGASGAPTLPPVGDVASRPERGAKQHLLIQIDTGKPI